ncbi:MAG: hypothetical protein ABIU54_12600 [Candidatus Eisenbacteria bacterium]
MRLLFAPLLMIITMGFAGGCSRAPSDHSTPGAMSDSLGNGLPRALVPRLAPWIQLWRTASPRFAPDSLTKVGSEPFELTAPQSGVRHQIPDARTRAGIEVLSPDSSKSVDFDVYLSIEAGGSREPDSSPALADFKSDTLWRVAFCGTACFYDGAYWLDANRFALTGASQTGEQADGPWGAFLEVYDLQSHRRTRWLSRSVDAERFERFRAANDSALTSRIERGGR